LQDYITYPDVVSDKPHSRLEEKPYSGGYLKQCVRKNLDTYEPVTYKNSLLIPIAKQVDHVESISNKLQINDPMLHLLNEDIEKLVNQKNMSLSLNNTRNL
jgi:hypothetical protein